jgi:hypothetical protein
MMINTFDDGAITMIRKTELADISACLSVIQKGYTQKRREDFYCPFPFEETQGLVLEHKDHGVIGFVVWKKDTLHITDICVDKDHRRHATTLINGLMDYAKEHHPNQWFEAQLLETTSYPLVKAMAKRGSLEFGRAWREP